MKVRIINRYQNFDATVYKLNTPFFIIIVLFLALNVTSVNIQALIMMLCSMYTIMMWFKKKSIDSLVMLFFLLAFTIAIWTLTSEYQISSYNFISEFKILILFTLPSFFYFLLDGLPAKKMLIAFFKWYVVLVLSVIIYGYVTEGVFRNTGFLGFSIYISVSQVLFLSYLYSETTLTWKILTFISVFMLGSSNGILVFFLLVFMKAALPIWMKIVPGSLGAVITYWYITVFRGRVLAEGGIWSVDRVMIFTSVLRYTCEHFSLLNYLFGFGIGTPLVGFRIIPHVKSDVANGFINWFMSLNQMGVFPFAFHNEFLRIFYNFGSIGLILILIYLYHNLDRITFTLLLLACLTNTIIYSTIGLFTLGFLMGVFLLEKKERA